MVEEILVFRGEQVTYTFGMKTIVCVSEDDCFTIYNVEPIHVRGECVEIYFVFDKTPIIEGNELWTNGYDYIIKYNPLIDKNQINPPIIRGRER